MSVKPAIMIVLAIALLDMAQYAIVIQAQMIGVSQIVRADKRHAAAIINAIVMRNAEMYLSQIMKVINMEEAALADSYSICNKLV
jgi:hypothetical protein